MRYGSVCSGIEAATCAWHPLGWEPAFFSEIEAFPRAVLAHHYASVPCHGDFTTIGADDYGPIDLLVGGTPCQSFSVAGLRGGLADDRGNLALEYLRLADRTRPRWLVWENVPGVLSSNGGRDFGSILGGMAELGYGFAYAVLDAQFFGVAQRRRRVFVVGHVGSWQRAAAVLFERHCLQGHPAPRREKGQVAPTVPSRSSAGGGLGTDFDCDGGLIAGALTATYGAQSGQDMMAEGMLAVAHSLRGEGFDASEDGTGRGTPLVPCYAIQERAVSENLENGPGGKGWQEGAAYTLEARNKVQSIAFSIMPMNSGKDYKARETDVAQPIMAGGPVGGNQGGDYVCHANGGVMPAVALMENQRAELRLSDQTDAMSTGGGKPGQGYPAAFIGSAVRRLTPRECERLQGFPDDYTLIPWRGKPAGECPDGPRYKALGNSMAVPCMSWLGRRIQQVESLSVGRLAA